MGGSHSPVLVKWTEESKIISVVSMQKFILTKNNQYTVSTKQQAYKIVENIKIFIYHYQSGNIATNSLIIPITIDHN